MLKTKRLEHVNKLALKFFIDSLNKSKRAQEYLYSRISKKTAKEFFVGYAPAGNGSFVEYLNKHKVSKYAAEELGLITFDIDDNAYELYANRIMIPIIHAGKLVGFAGRTIINADIKYINSKTSVLYNKSEVLYGLWKTRKAIWRVGHCFLVEGYFDVLGTHNLGLTNCAASCGTAFTRTQALALRRYTNRVFILYDGDDAGRAAAKKAKAVLKNTGIYGGIILLPEGKDPDTFIEKFGKAALYKLKAVK